MKLLFKTFCPDMGTHPDYALVHIDEEFRSRLLRMKELFQMVHAKVDELTRMDVWSGACFFYEDHEGADGELVVERLLDDEVVPAPADFTPPNEPLETDCDRLVVEERGVYWTAHPDHGDETIDTATLTWDALIALPLGGAHG